MDPSEEEEKLISGELLTEEEFENYIQLLDASLESSRSVRRVKNYKTIKGSIRRRIERQIVNYNFELLSGVNDICEVLQFEGLQRLVKTYGVEPDQSDVCESQLPVVDVVDDSEGTHLDILGFQVEKKINAVPGPSLTDHTELWLFSIRETSDVTKDQYSRMVADSMTHRTTSTNAIIKDLGRTFPHCKDFIDYGDGYHSLHRLLSTVSHTVPFGYCQGMNFIAGILLLVTKSELHSYRLLLQVISSDFYNGGYYDEQMTNCVLDQMVLKELVMEHASKAYNDLEKAGINLGDITIRWLLCIFVDVVSSDILLSIWDVYFSEGICFLHKLAVHIFSSLKLPSGADFSQALETINISMRNLSLSDVIAANAMMYDNEQLKVMREKAKKKKNKDNKPNEKKRFGMFSPKRFMGK